VGLALGVLMAAAGALRLPLLHAQPIQHDEVYSYVAALGFLHRRASVFDPTGYPYDRAALHQALAAGALALGGEDLAVSRLLSVVASLLSIPVLYAVARHLTGRRAALLACALLAFSTFEGFYAVSARMYSVFQLFFMLSIWAALATGRAPRRVGPWVALGLACLAASATHRLFLISAPFLLAGLALWIGWRLPRRGALVALGAVASVAVVTWAGFLIESAASVPPAGSAWRQEYGSWGLAVGNPLQNVGLLFFQVLNERAPLTPWIALLAVPYALSRGSAALGFTALLCFGSGIAVAAGVALQGARYYLHLLPLVLALACAGAELLLRDAKRGHDVVREWVEAGARPAAWLRQRLPWLPRDRALVGLLAGLLAALALGGDLLMGERPGLGHDQIVVLTSAVLLGLGCALWPLWPRFGAGLSRALGPLLGLAVLLSIPAWLPWLGRYRFPPFQAEAFQVLEAELRPGDRLVATEHLAVFLRFGGRVPMALLSQRVEGERFGPYASPTDWVTGIPIVDEAAELEQWLGGEGRTFILADFRFDLHLDEALRRRVEALPLVYRSDPAKLEGLPPHPEWAGDTGELRLWRTP
jgi:hypothetical protein